MRRPRTCAHWYVGVALFCVYVCIMRMHVCMYGVRGLFVSVFGHEQPDPPHSLGACTCIHVREQVCAYVCFSDISLCVARVSACVFVFD